VSLATNTSPMAQRSETPDVLLHLAALPDWLMAATQPNRVVEALERNVEEFVAGTLLIQRCKLDRLRLKGQHWDARYELVISGLNGESVTQVMLAGTLTPPNINRSDQGETTGVFGTTEWHVYLPELRLDLRMDAEEEELEALPLLADAEQARAFLETSIRAGWPAYSDIAIHSCAPKVMRNKPGRCTIRYQLQYETNAEVAKPWPAMVIAKTYSRDQGQNAYESMRKLWASPLSIGNIVSIAEPLAYVPEHKVLVQGPVRGEYDLKDLLRSALRAGTPQAIEELHQVIRKTAAGLAALHHSGARHGEIATWEEELTEIREEVEKLGVVLPWFTTATAPLLAGLDARAAMYPADPALPAHRSFRPQQVLIHQGNIGFIDFDGFCLAEPALDIALFRATIKEMGINTSPSNKQKEFEYASEAARLTRLNQLDTIGEVFLSAYEQKAPVSRQRVALWEALDLLTVVLRCWTKGKPHQLDNAILLFDSHLRDSGLQPA
jgi:hypothetical protein